jgi:hypothetical protein
MKRLFIVGIIASLSFFVSAQAQTDTVRTVLKEGDKIGFFTGPYYRNAWFGNSASSFGGGAGFYFNHKYYIYLQTTSFPIEKSSKNEDRFVMNTFGPSVGYCHKPANKFHFVFGTQIYSANVVNDENINPGNDIDLKYLLIAPEIYLEVNIVSYVRFYVGPSYYFSIGKDAYEWITNKYIRGFSINAGLLVGKF